MRWQRGRERTVPGGHVGRTMRTLQRCEFRSRVGVASKVWRTRPAAALTLLFSECRVMGCCLLHMTECALVWLSGCLVGRLASSGCRCLDLLPTPPPPPNRPPPRAPSPSYFTDTAMFVFRRANQDADQLKRSEAYARVAQQSAIIFGFLALVRAAYVPPNPYLRSAHPRFFLGRMGCWLPVELEALG